MPRPREVREEIILKAARDTFIAKGAEAKTRDIAEAAGVSQALLFQRYGTKKRLFFAAMLPKPPKLEELIGLAPGNSAHEAEAYLAALSVRLLAWIERTLPGSLRAALHPDFPDALTAAHGPEGADRIVDAIATRLSEMKKARTISRRTETDEAARALIDLLHGHALTTLLSGRSKEKSDVRARRATRVFLWGLRP